VSEETTLCKDCGGDGAVRTYSAPGVYSETTCWTCQSLISRAKFDQLLANNAALREELSNRSTECTELSKLAQFYKKQSQSRLEHLGDYIDDPKQLIAEAEAWRAVRGTYESNAEEVSSVALGSIEDAFKAQIARLDQLKAPTPTGGE